MIIVGWRDIKYVHDRPVILEQRCTPCEDLTHAKKTLRSMSERCCCDERDVGEVWAEFHDTEAKRTWSVYMIGTSKHDYRTETTGHFVERYEGSTDKSSEILEDFR